MTQEKENEFELMRVIKEEAFEEIERKLKPSALKYCESNTLVMGMKVRVFFFVFFFPFFVPGLRQVVCAYLLGPVKGLI